MTIRAIQPSPRLTELKKAFVQQATAPLDGMWLDGFVPQANHFGFFHGDQLIGYVCVNDEGFVLQFFVSSDHRAQSSRWFGALLSTPPSPAGEIHGAFVSTAEPDYLSLCADHFTRLEVNALMYQLDDDQRPSRSGDAGTLTCLTPDQLTDAVDFAVDSLGAPADWLRQYYGRLIDRQELFGLWDDGRLLAAGERRDCGEFQTGVADVGMVVAPSARGRGLATDVLKQLVAMNDARNVQSICSTEASNVGARKAIERSGFFPHHRILQCSRS